MKLSAASEFCCLVHYVVTKLRASQCGRRSISDEWFPKRETATSLCLAQIVTNTHTTVPSKQQIKKCNCRVRNSVSEAIHGFVPRGQAWTKTIEGTTSENSYMEEQQEYKSTDTNISIQTTTTECFLCCLWPEQSAEKTSFTQTASRETIIYFPINILKACCVTFKEFYWLEI